MLEKQLWMDYADDLPLDWQHAFEEGKDVEAYYQECLDIKNMPSKDEVRTSLAEELYYKLKNAPYKKDYTYQEPSGLDDIKKLRPKNQPGIQNQLKKEPLYDKIYGAWLGRVSGCLLGKPVEGWHTTKLNRLLKATDNDPLHHYLSSEIPQELKNELGWNEKAAWVNQINGKAPVDDDTNYTVLGLKIIEKYGRDFTPNDVAEAWLSYMPYLAACTAERVAYKNFASGIFPPNSATYKNPFREWIGAQIRADFYGYINPGNPEAAAEMAWRDASISHVKNGIYGEMFVAAMLAAAAISNDIIQVIQTGLSQIPLNCRLTEKILQLLTWHMDGMDEKEAFLRIHQMYDEKNAHHWCHTISNAMVVVYALLYGNLDFEKSICLAVQAGFDTDCNGATVGSITGMMLGGNRIPEKWTKPFADKLLTNIQDYEEVKLSEIAEKTMKYIP